MSDRKPTLDDLVRDMKADRGPTPDWRSVDEKLFARLEAEPKPAAEGEPAERTGGRLVWIGAAVTLAAAAAALLLVRPSSDGIATSEVPAVSAGAFVGGGADVELGGAVAASGQPLAQSESVAVRSGTAYFEQAGAVRWSASSGSKLRVEHAASPLVLSLESGASEAQVTPVPAGEAFAIDVTSSSGAVVRVAVHGTHLRVAREGDKVTVDLNEGVVSIGAPPRRGSTIGALVTAPAHIELDARDPAATMHVDHDRASVRPAEAVSPRPVAQKDSALATAVALAAGGPGDDASPMSHPLLAPAAVQKPTAAESPAPAAAPQVQLRTPDDVGAAVKACIADASTNREGVGFTFTTTLTLFVDGDGNVQRAHFYPPLMPQSDLQDCVARAIYQRTRLSRSGDVVIPIAISR